MDKGAGFVLITVLLFIVVSLTTGLGLLGLVSFYLNFVSRDYQTEQAFHLAEAGIDWGVYQLNQNPNFSGEENRALGNGVFSITTATIDTTTKKLTSQGFIPNLSNPQVIKKIEVKVSNQPSTSEVNFRYGVQVGEGGLTLSANDQIVGNIYSNGTITASGNNNQITNDAFAASQNAIEGPRSFTIGSNAHAHRLSGITVGGGAYYQEINNVQAGSYHPQSPDPESLPFPINDEQIDSWKNEAVEGGIYNGNLADCQTSLGPIKVVGNWEIRNHCTTTIYGTIWVTGGLTADNQNTLKLASGYEENGGVIVVDGKITLKNGNELLGSGEPESLLMLISASHGEQTEGKAIEISNTLEDGILYANHGKIAINNSNTLKQLTGYGIILANNVTVTYESGFAQTFFTDGPGGTYKIQSGSWKIIP